MYDSATNGGHSDIPKMLKSAWIWLLSSSLKDSSWMDDEFLSIGGNTDLATAAIVMKSFLNRRSGS